MYIFVTQFIFSIFNVSMSMETLRLEEKEAMALASAAAVLVALSKAGGRARRALGQIDLEGLDGALAVGDSSSLVPRVSL